MIKTNKELGFIWELVVRYKDGSVRCLYFEERKDAECEFRTYSSHVGDFIRSMELNRCSLSRDLKDCKLV